MYDLGSNAQSNTGFEDTSSYPDLTVSGFFKVKILSAFWNRKDKKDGTGTFDMMSLSTVCYTAKGDLAGKCNFSVFLPSNHANNLAYFLNLRDPQTGHLYIADPEEMTAKNGNKFYVMKQLEGKSVYALLEEKGMYLNQQGQQKHTFNLVSFCDHRGFSAEACEIKSEVRDPVCQGFIDKLKAGIAAKAAPTPQPQARPQAQPTLQYGGAQQSVRPQAVPVQEPQFSTDDDLPF